MLLSITSSKEKIFWEVVWELMLVGDDQFFY
jgi:hypothetical protein